MTYKRANHYKPTPELAAQIAARREAVDAIRVPRLTRIGQTEGRFPSYRLLFDGVDIGSVKRKIAKGRDGAGGRKQPAYDVWAIHGTDCTSRAAAEQKLLDRAIRFGLIKR